MSDPGIKLFGMTIALPPAAAGEEGGGHDLLPKGSLTPNETKEDKEQDSPKSKENFDPVTPTTADDVRKLSSDDDDRKNDGRPNDSSNPQDKPLKKPDKILPCPRCNSMDTKFCYYNNYNVNQPRHFCKNCQRYWTAGGTMRNVPIGAGRRKNKILAYRHLTVSDITLQANLKSNGTVLSFGADTPICDSMASVLNLSDRTRMNCNQNDEQSSGSSAATTVSNSSLIDEGNGANLHEPVIQYCQGFGPHLPYANGSPWPHPWSPPPVQFYPAAAYWGCSNWGMPWFSPQLPPPPTIISTGLSGSGSISPTLGKHSREGNTLARDNNNTNDSDSSDKRDGFRQGNLWIPKTLRIDDPEEAAKSSIWATMGFKNDKGDGISSRGGLFKAFEAKAKLNNHKVDSNSQVFCANPAALSRSINFQESS